MREIVKVRAGSNGEISVAIPKDIRAVVPLKAGDKVLMTARGGQIIIEAETTVPFGRNKRKK
jgi:AbrB family looped-hinge helix DNA binding protein